MKGLVIQTKEEARVCMIVGDIDADGVCWVMWDDNQEFEEVNVEAFKGKLPDNPFEDALKKESTLSLADVIDFGELGDGDETSH